MRYYLVAGLGRAWSGQGRGHVTTHANWNIMTKCKCKNLIYFYVCLQYLDAIASVELRMSQIN